MTEEKQTVSKTNYIISLIVVAIIGVLGAGGAYFVGVWQGSPARQSGSTSITVTEQPLDDELSLDDVEAMYHTLMNHYYEEVDSKTLIEGALEGMADSLGDPHTAFLNSVDTAELNDSISGSFEGIGAEVMKDGDAVRIMSPIADSPADKAGLQADDLILEVDGQSVQDLNVTEAVQLIRGEKGTEVNLKLRRNEEEFTLAVTRDTIPLESVKTKIDESDQSIGHVHITRFNSTTYDELVAAIKELQSQNVEKFIFDVRGNPGGLLDVAIKMGNIFVDNGEPIMQIQADETEQPHVFLASDEYGDFKFDRSQYEAVLLVNEGSASASEILAGAMQHAGYPIIGTPTYGKGTVQTIQELSDHTEVKFTHQIWLTASGDFINEKGVMPDEEVERSQYGDLLIVDAEATYKLGDQSQEVENINRILNMLGYDVTVSDQFTEQTKTAIEQIQTEHQLNVTGVVHDSTAMTLMRLVQEYFSEHDDQYDYAVDKLQD